MRCADPFEEADPEPDPEPEPCAFDDALAADDPACGAVLGGGTGAPPVEEPSAPVAEPTEEVSTPDPAEVGAPFTSSTETAPTPASALGGTTLPRTGADLGLLVGVAGILVLGGLGLRTQRPRSGAGATGG